MIWLIGSQAVKYHLQHKMYRRCVDYDLMCTPDNLTQIEDSFKRRGVEYKMTESPRYPGKYRIIAAGFICEIDATNNESTKFLTDSYNDVQRSVIDIPNIHSVMVPSLHMLYGIKRAHAGLPVHTEKTLLDLIKLGRRLFDDQPGNIDTLNHDERELYMMLKTEAEVRDAGRKRRINFNKPADEFFKQSEKFRDYTHDLVHEATCRWDKPLFRENLKYENKALIDMDLFMSRDLEYKLTMVQEEAMVIGIERYFMENRSIPESVVYRYGLTKLIRDLSKGRFQEFMLTHIHLLTEPKWNFLERFVLAEQRGLFT